MVLNYEEIRNWIVLVLAIAGFCVAYRELVNNTNQRKTENSFRYIDLFYSTISKNDMESWKMVYRGSYKDGSIEKFVSSNAIVLDYSELFTEGSPDNGAVNRMCEVFELIAEAVSNNKVDLRLIYFELGQFMEHNSSWLNVMEKSNEPRIVKFERFIKLMKDDNLLNDYTYKTVYLYE